MAAMHEIPWNAKPTFSSASVISETLYADKIDYFFFAALFFFLAASLCFFACALQVSPPREDFEILMPFGGVRV